jgi:DNA-binding NarL/FixJ family response regulator
MVQTTAVKSEVARVLVVDDQPSIRKALRNLLETQGAFQMCGEAKDGFEALQKVQELDPEIILMDISMPGLDGLEATRRILKAHPNAQVLIITQFQSAQAVQAARNAGARGYLAKSEAGHHLIQALTTIGQHQPFFPSSPQK